MNEKKQKLLNPNQESRSPINSTIPHIPLGPSVTESTTLNSKTDDAKVEPKKSGQILKPSRLSKFIKINEDKNVSKEEPINQQRETRPKQNINNSSKNQIVDIIDAQNSLLSVVNTLDLQNKKLMDYAKKNQELQNKNDRLENEIHQLVENHNQEISAKNARIEELERTMEEFHTFAVSRIKKLKKEET